MPMLKIWRGHYTEFGVESAARNTLREETCTAMDAYSDETLESIASSGFNAFWVHGLLRNLVQTDVFPELGQDADRHIEHMGTLMGRAAQHGLKVVLYMQPPRGIPVLWTDFWKNHPDVAGPCEKRQDGRQNELATNALCTSSPKVRAYLHAAAAGLARNLPALGGVIMITASEFTSHCLARAGRVIDAVGNVRCRKSSCRRCDAREPADVIAEIIHTVRAGIRQHSATMPILAWNWSWTFFYDRPCMEIIEKLPQDVILLAGFERGGSMDLCGKKDVYVNEYSLTYPGPSEQFRETMTAAREQGLRVGAKLQLGTTHELATVPNLPVLANVRKKADFVRRNGIVGFMGCWNFGNMISANTAGFNYFLSDECPDDEDTALRSFAALHFPGCDETAVVAAWHTFGDAMTNYPFSIPFLYMSPVNYSLAYVPYPTPLNDVSAGRSWLPDQRGDDLSASLNGPFDLDEIIAGLNRLQATWMDGVQQLARGLTRLDHAHAAEELGTARVCGAVFRSTRNTYMFYRLRLKWRAADAELTAYTDIARDELENLRQILPSVVADTRLGFHSEAHFQMFDADKITLKIQALEQQIGNTAS